MLFPGVRVVRAAACSVGVVALAMLAVDCGPETVTCPDVGCLNTFTVKVDVAYGYPELSGKSLDVCRGQACTHFTFRGDDAGVPSSEHDCSSPAGGGNCTVSTPSGGKSEITVVLAIDPPFPKGDLYHVVLSDDATGKAEIDAYRAVKYTYSRISPGHPECGGCAGAGIDLQPGSPQYADCTSGTCVSN